MNDEMGTLVPVVDDEPAIGDVLLGSPMHRSSPGLSRPGGLTALMAAVEMIAAQLTWGVKCAAFGDTPHD